MDWEGNIAFCPHCGHNFEADKPIEFEGWRVTLAGVWQGEQFHRLSAAQAIIVHSIAKAGGKPVPLMALAERSGCDADSNVVTVLICRIRAAIPGIPIVTDYGRGYRWGHAGSPETVHVGLGAPHTPVDGALSADCSSFHKKVCSK